MDASQRLALNESFQPFESQRELAQSQRALPREAPFAKSLEVFRQGVLRALDDPKILAAAALHGWLQKPT